MHIPAVIALIEPPSPSLLSGFPLGLASLATSLESRTIWKAHILDFQAENDWDRIKDVIAKECVEKGIRVFGIRTLTPTYGAAKKTAGIIKELAPDAVVIAGGPHVSVQPEICLQHNPAIDIVVVGEGEQTLAELVGALGYTRAMAAVKGIVYRAENGDMVKSAARALMSGEMLAALPFDYDRFLDYGRYANGDHSTIMITSRGCPFGCAFCSAAQFWGAGTYRMRPIAHVMRELEHLVLKKGVRRIYFEDALFNFNKTRVLELCDAIIAKRRDHPEFVFTWRPPCRVDLLDREMLSKMKKAGCTDIFFGLETFDERQLKAIKGGGIAATGAAYRDYIGKVEEIFGLCREEGIETIAAMILGLPYETESTFTTNIDMLRRIRPDKLTFSVLCLYAGAPLLAAYAREPGYEWLDKLLGQDDIFEKPIDDGSGAALNTFSVHGPQAIKPRYLKKEAFLAEGKIEHDIDKMVHDYNRYREGLENLDGRSLSITNIRAFTER